MWRSGAIECLSVEVLGQIFGHLEGDDLLSASGVCRYWFNIVNSYLLRRKKSAILRPEADDFIPDWHLDSLSLVGFENERFQTIKHLCASVKTLYIGYDGGVQKRILNETALAELLNGCLKLQELSFNDVIPTDSVLTVITERGLNRLCSLSFKCESSHLTNLDMEKVLERSYFQETSLVLRSSNAENNMSMIMRYPFSFDKPVMCKYIPECITMLKVDCSGLSKVSYMNLRFCENLRSIKLLNAYQIHDDTVISLAKLPYISEMYITDAKSVTSVGWMAVFHRTEMAKITLIRSAAGLCDTVFENMISTAAGRCIDIDLQSCKGVSTEGVLSLLGSSERVSLVIDYNEQLLNFLVSDMALKRTSPCLRVLNITVQRIHATSEYDSLRSTTIAHFLANRFSYCNINFSYKELFTKVDRIHDRIR